MLAFLPLNNASIVQFFKDVVNRNLSPKIEAAQVRQKPGGKAKVFQSFEQAVLRV